MRLHSYIVTWLFYGYIVTQLHSNIGYSYTIGKCLSQGNVTSKIMKSYTKEKHSKLKIKHFPSNKIS